jgi:hypothetical protein
MKKRTAARLLAPAWIIVLFACGVPAGRAHAQDSRPAPAPALKTKARAAAADSLIAIVRTLAQPAWEGRGVGTAGIDSAADYIAAVMSASGLKPGGENGGWFQSFEVTTGVQAAGPNAVEVRGKRFDLGRDFQPIGFSTNGTLLAPLVFAGYGISAPGYEYDDYAGLDVRDKLVVVLTNEPGEMDEGSRFDGTVNTPHADLRTKAIVARQHGALGLIVVNGPKHHAGESLRPPKKDGTGYMTSGLLAAVVSDAVAVLLFSSSGRSLEELQEAIDRETRPQSFALSDSVRLTVALQRTRSNVRNVIGWIPGQDTTRTLVVGAHYDHLGYGGEGSLAPDEKAPHLGADDNASGTAALLGVARRFGTRSAAGSLPAHNLVFAAFTGEESGLLGSGHYVDDPLKPLETTEVMLNMDMVGRLRDDRLSVMGVGTAKEFPALVQATNEAVGRFALKTSDDGYGPSDHASFYKREVPVLFLFTGGHADYHKPTDTWDKINVSGLERISSFAAALVESLDARPPVTYQKAKADSATAGRISGGAGYGAYLGTIPDYMQTEGGVLLSGVREGGPAAAAGLKGGDTIVEFDGIRVDNIYDYTYALRSRKPGQSVRITVLREGEKLELTATLGRRS